MKTSRDNYNDNNNNIDNNNDNNNNKIENKFELFKSIVPYAYCSTSIPSSMNNIKTKKYDHNNNNDNNDNNNNDNTYVKDDVINLIEDDIKRRLGYNYNNQSSYASYPANDPCEDRIAIINKPSYRIGKRTHSE